jgi:hypothetical protein
MRKSLFLRVKYIIAFLPDIIFSLSQRTGSANVFTINCAHTSAAASPKHLISPPRSSGFPEIREPDVEHHRVEVTPALQSSDCDVVPPDVRTESDIPDAVLLEVHIPLPTTVVDQDPTSQLVSSDMPVSLASVVPTCH